MRSPLSHIISLLAAFIIAASVGACERPFVERNPPEIEVLSPDLDVVQVNRMITLRIRVTSLDEVDSIVVNERRMVEDDSDEQVFSQEMDLFRGVNRLRIQVFGSFGTERDDTLAVVFLPGSEDLADFRLPDPRGGHSTTLLQNGDLLVLGGAPLPTSPAVGDGLVFDADNLAATPRTIPMTARRMEHTANLLPDGRVLIIGGSQVFNPAEVEQLVETVELYDPVLDRVVAIPVSGDPIRRSSHTTVVLPVQQGAQSGIFVYLYGGFGDIRYNPTPRMGVRSDIRVLQFRNDSLVAVGPTIGAFIEAIADHRVIDLEPQFESEAEYLFGGAFFVSDEIFDSIAFESTFSVGNGIIIEDVEPMNQARSGHAAGQLLKGEVLIFGGRGFSRTSAMSTIEVYHSRAKRFFEFPSTVSMIQERWGHTATKWDRTRILLLGGFGSTGAGLLTAEWFIVDSRKVNPARNSE